MLILVRGIWRYNIDIRPAKFCYFGRHDTCVAEYFEANTVIYFPAVNVCYQMAVNRGLQTRQRSVNTL